MLTMKLLAAPCRWGHVVRIMFLMSAGVLLGGCGGGGSGPSAGVNPPPVASYPSSGEYGYLLLSGSGSTPVGGLALIHGSSRSIHHVIEPSGTGLSDTMEMYSGTLDVAGKRVTELKGHALLYIVGGEVRRVSLRANGAAPAPTFRKSGGTNACKFAPEVSAMLYTAPDASKVFVRTNGADRRCDTSDDELALLGLGSGFVAMPGPTEILAYLSDPATLLPAGVVTASAAHNEKQSFFLNAERSTVNRILALSGASVLYERKLANGTLQLARVAINGDAALYDAVLTGGAPWSLIGYDSGAYYVYRNKTSASLGGSTQWQALKLSRQSSLVTPMANGVGQVISNAIGDGKLFVSILGSTNTTLRAIDKAGSGPEVVLATVPITSTVNVIASAQGVHQFWRINDLGISKMTFSIDMRDETNTVHATFPGGMPMGFQQPSAISFEHSERRSRFIIATPFATRGYSNAQLIAYDSTARTATVLGTLPGTEAYGNDPVIATIVASSNGLVAGQAARTVNAVIQASDAQAFSAISDTASSLMYSVASK